MFWGPICPKSSRIVVFILSVLIYHTVALKVAFDGSQTVDGPTQPNFMQEKDDHEHINSSISMDKIQVTGNKTMKPTSTGDKLNLNSTHSQSLPQWMTAIKSGALERTGFVVLGIALIVIALFVIRGVRVRHKKSKSRKYGIITSTDMEMEPLDNDDDEEEDTTLFDAQHKYTLP